MLQTGECKFQTPGNGDLKGVIYVLFGRDIAGRVRYIEREDGGIRVSGYISEPDFFRPNRNMQNFLSITAMSKAARWRRL